MQIKSQLQKLIYQAVCETAGVCVPQDQIHLEHPEAQEHGDYSTNIALTLKGGKKLAEKIAAGIKSNELIEKVEVAGPGFINIWLQRNYLSTLLSEVTKRLSDEDTRKIMVEFAHPNTHKAFHIGHLRNITVGESIVRILEAKGIKVIRANYQGDVGMHIAKAIYALTSISPYNDEAKKIVGVKQRAEFLGKAYAAGSQAYENDEDAKSKIHDYNYLVYAAAQRFQEEKGLAKSSTDYVSFVKERKDEINIVYDLWKETRQWSLDYFESIYSRVGTKFDRYYFESECLSGVDLAKDAVKSGILKESEGAIIFPGEEYDINTRVFVNSLGLPTYEAKELALSKKEFTEFGTLDKILHVVGPEQASFFQVTFKAEELLGTQKDQQQHLVYGWVKLKQGKMSSRTGNVVLGEWLLDEVKNKVLLTYKNSDETADKIATSAVKYSFLKVGLDKEIAFDIDESISLEGNSGPYLQYTYARTCSVLSKSQDTSSKIQTEINTEELAILRFIYRFNEVVEEAATRYAPNLICNFLYELAQRFNTFYNKHKILDNEFRLLLTRQVGEVLKTGLNLLGIEALERM